MRFIITSSVIRHTLNGQSKRLVSSQELLSVPYAFLAEKAIVAQTAVDIDDADADPTNELQILSLTGDSLTLSNGNTISLPSINDADADPTNEIQFLSRSSDTISLSNGGFVVLPVDQVNDADADPNNEIQVLSRTNDTIFLSNGGYTVLPIDQVDDADADPTNELQTLTKSGGNIYLTNGGSVAVFDGDYNDLNNTPAIPTNTSDLTNDSGFLTLEVDGSTTNELQAISRSNDTIFLSSGGFVVLPTDQVNDADADPNNEIQNLEDILFVGNNASNKAVFNIKRQSIGHLTPDTSAVLDVASITQGFLPPRMTKAQRDAIYSPTAGLILWCMNCGTNGELQVFNGTEYTNIVGGEASPVIEIGSYLFGGVVFYIAPVPTDLNGDGNINYGLVCDINDLTSSNIKWANTSVATGATDTSIGKGSYNTDLIINSQGATQTGYAAVLAKSYNGGGYTDWFLPSRNELDEVWKNRSIIDSTANANNGSSFDSSWYWSSTEDSSNPAAWSWYQLFMISNWADGAQNFTVKYNLVKARAIRAF